MKNTKYILLGAIGIAAILLITSDKAKPMRDDLADKAKKKMNKWKDRLGKLSSDTADSVEDLKDMLTSEVKGLSDDARERISNILSGASDTVTKAKKNVSQQLS